MACHKKPPRFERSVMDALNQSLTLWHPAARQCPALNIKAMPTNCPWSIMQQQQLKTYATLRKCSTEGSTVLPTMSPLAEAMLQVRVASVNGRPEMTLKTLSEKGLLAEDTNKTVIERVACAVLHLWNLYKFPRISLFSDSDAVEEVGNVPR